MRYKYQALDSQGQEISGVITAAHPREATRLLQRRGLVVARLETDTGKAAPARAGRLKRRDLLIALHELVTLLESGVALIDAVESLAESASHPSLVQTFAGMAMKLRQGGNFSAALRDSGLPLPKYMPQLAEAGELTGKLAPALRGGLEQMEYSAQVAEEMRGALAYPVILTVSGIGAILLVFTMVVPRFAQMLQNRNAGELPILAKIVLHTGTFMQHYGWWLMGGIAALLFFLGYLLSRPALREKLLESSLRLPLVGGWVLEAETGRWAAMLGALLENRVPLLRALELAQDSLALPGLRGRLGQTARAVRTGAALSQALQDHGALTPTGHNLIRVGERAGELPRMLKSLAKLYGESSRARMRRFLLVIEPVAILLIGGVIGTIITGVILAITSVHQIRF